VPVAPNCSVPLSATFGLAGATVIDVSSLVCTVSEAVPVIVPIAAVTVVEPAATPVAKPLELIVAMPVGVVVQVAVPVTEAVEPSL
jgi:hypothetical protein